MNIYEIQPDYCNEAIIKPKKLKRVEIGNNRFYRNETTNLLCSSVTTVLHKTMPTSPFLVKWYADLGLEKAKQVMNDKANYGTLMHCLFTQYLLTKVIDFDNDLIGYLEFNKIDIAKIDILELKKDVLSFIQFIKEKNVTPIAIEYPVINNYFAGTIDLICEMDFNGKRVIAIVDYKSGKKGFYDSHRVQLHAYKNILEETTDIKIDMLFNFAPKDWRITETIKPTYDLENQSNVLYTKQWLLYSELYLLELQKEKSNVINDYELSNIITDDFNNLLTINTFEVSNGL